MATDINVLAAIGRFEEELRHDVEETRRDLLLAILERWEHDSDLTLQSRRRARELLWEFGHDLYRAGASDQAPSDGPLAKRGSVGNKCFAREHREPPLTSLVPLDLPVPTLCGQPLMPRDVVLVVDDHADIREGIAVALGLEGYAVVTASSGLDALNKLHAGLHPCLIILDLMMPVMNGFAFRQAQLGEPELAKIPLIAYSAVTDPNVTAQHLRADAYLYKPTDMAQMTGLVRQVCQKRPPATAAG